MTTGKKTMADYRELRANVRAQLSAMGLSEERLALIYSQLTQYMETDIESLRETQFADTAYDLMIQIKSSSAKNDKMTAAFLRRFAHHIAASLFPDRSAPEIEELIDAIEEMSPSPFGE